jgi:hypothetical protein
VWPPSASWEAIYRMSSDWSETRYLQGKDFISDTRKPSQGWLEKYIHPDDQRAVLAAINDTIKNKIWASLGF